MYYVGGVPDPDGRHTDALAKKYSQDNGVSYSAALHAVVRGEQNKQRRYAAANPEEGQAIQKLGATVASLPKLADGAVDMDLALEVINNSETFRTLAQAAAGEHLNHLATQLLGTAKAHEGVTFEDALKATKRDNPSVSSMYGGNKASAEGLRQILWTIFKYSSSSGVRKYSSSHISYDSNGNEIRRYDLSVVRR